MADLSTPWALRTAVTLGLPDLLADGATGTAELARRTGADPGALDRLLHHLAAREVCTRDGDGWALTGDGETLRRGHPSRMADWLDAGGAAGQMDRVWARLPDAVRSGAPQHAAEHGAPLYDDLAADPALQSSFDRLMSADAVDYGAVLDPDGDPEGWGSAHRVVDVGGGRGDLLATLLARHLHLHGCLVEQPEVLATATDVLAPVAGRVQTVAADFLSGPLPAGADRYVLASVLHNWDDATAAAILRRVADAAAPGARVLVVESLPAEDRGFATHLDLKMLVLLGGRERGPDGLDELARTAGLEPAGHRRTPRGPFGLAYAVCAYTVPNTAP